MWFSLFNINMEVSERKKKIYRGPGTPRKTILEELAIYNKIWINRLEQCSNPSGTIEENIVSQRMR